MSLRIKCLLTVLVCSLFYLNSHAQESKLSVEASQNMTNFKFTDSEGNQDKNYLFSYSGSYAFGYQYHLENGMFFLGKMGMRKGGATYLYDGMNYSWELKYAEARLGVGYMYTLEKMNVHLSAQGYYAHLLKANQRLNNENFDILDLDLISSDDFGLIISPGVSMSATERMSLFLELNYLMGLANLETNEAQTSNNQLYGATLGVAFTIK